ncbi:HNH endonuclease [Iodobacter arcticus]|uniref:HNH endonuclease n=1 Tax=Iodobacter arcticus TaxID=590593 RepID=A0ABW2R2K3_9NEIS
MKSDYAAVTEQSGLFAGKDGFEIKVKNNTDLNGAVIASKSDDNTLSTGTLTQKDINNRAEYSASSIGIGGGFSMGGTEKKPEDGKAPSTDQAATPSGNKLYDAGPSGVTPTAPVALSAGDNGTSTTKSAIATAKITITDEAKQKELTGKTSAETIASLSRDTDGAQQQLANDFKPEKINELFSATKTFLQEGNTFMANRTAEADVAKKALDGTSASLKAEQAKPQDQQNQALISQLDTQQKSLAAQKTEADKWTPGGDYGRAMTALQAAVGGNVSGGVTGLVQNASVAYLQSIGAEKIKDIADSFQTKKGEENQTSQNVRAALHAIASCAGAAVSASNCSSAAVGAASSVVINNVLSEIENTNADKMTASEKEKRKNLVGSIITGIVAATDGNAAAANNAAQIEMQNNWLSPSQQAQHKAELANAKNGFEKAVIETKWFIQSAKQDAAFAIGVAGGVYISADDLARGVAQVVTHLPETINSLQQLVNDPQARKQMGEVVYSEYKGRLNLINQAYRDGGVDASITLGVEVTRLVVDVAGVVGGAKAGAELAAKLPAATAKALGEFMSHPSGSMSAQLGAVGDVARARAVGGKVKSTSVIESTTEKHAQSPYSPSTSRQDQVLQHGADNVTSTTVPPMTAKNVQLAGQRHPITGVVFDKRGYPIFDDVSRFDTKFTTDSFKKASYTDQMKMASNDLWSSIQKKQVNANMFTEAQLRQIQGGASKIDGYTWHHHQDSGRMQLVPQVIHSKTGHIGGDAMSKGQ